MRLHFLSPRSLRGFILTAAIGASLLVFALAYGITSWISRGYVAEEARQDARYMAEQTFASMYQIMRKGWQREDVEDFLHSLERTTADRDFDIEIYRGEIVSALFGPLRGRETPQAVGRAFRAGEPVETERDNLLVFAKPLKAKEECQRCHTNAGVGDVLGVIRVSQDIGSQLRGARNDFRTAFLLIALLPLGAAVGVARILGNRIDRSMGELGQSIEQVNRVSDLSHMEHHGPRTGFEEVDRVADHVQELSGRLQNIAVDRDLLELENRLLEKFVITSDVVRDWQDYIKTLQVEINTVMEAYLLFSLFQVEEEGYDLEIFWLQQPSPRTKALVTAAIHAILRKEPPFQEPTEIQIHHHVSDPEQTMPDLSQEELEVQTHSLLLDRPKIGGIVGIGVHTRITQDATRTLVTESILSTLLNLVGSVRAISQYTRDLEYYASRDPLTELYNQRTFRELLAYELDRAERNRYPFGLLMVDLDNFKALNDHWGHNFGDQFLREFARELTRMVRPGDAVARWGGDEFVAMLPEAGYEQTYLVARRVIEAADGVVLRTPDGNWAHVTVSVGAAIFPDHASKAQDLFMFADNMMYRAKSHGKHRIGMPTDEDVVEVFRELSQKNLQVQQAIDEGLLIPYFQPIVDIASGETAAFEVLGRIRGEDGVTLAAGEFIEQAEQMGVIHKVDYQIMAGAFARARDADFRGELFINLSPRALVLSEFLETVRRLTREHGLAPERIILELTERETVHNLTLLERFVADLRRDGFRFGIDDFGSGFASFQYLKRLPVDLVKVEGEFVANMARNPLDYAFVKSMVTLAQEAGIRSVAEFIEDQDVLDLVGELGSDLGQGFHLGCPRSTLDLRPPGP